MIIDHKLLVVTLAKDVASLSHRLQRILLQIHQYNIRILYKPETQLFIADWLSRHIHKTISDKENLGMHIRIKATESCTDIPDYMGNH